MKIIVVLFACLVYLNFTCAMLRGPGVNQQASQEDFVADRSPVFVQMPGDYVVTGTLYHFDSCGGIPSWMRTKELSRPSLMSPQHVFLYMPGYRTTFAKANLGLTVHKKNDTNIQGHNCFVKSKHAVFNAHLLPQPDRITLPSTPHIYVRTPVSEIVYGGKLEHLAEQNTPIWVK